MKKSFTSFFQSNSLKKRESYNQLTRGHRNYDLPYNEWDGASLDPVGLTEKYFKHEEEMEENQHLIESFRDWAGTVKGAAKNPSLSKRQKREDVNRILLMTSKHIVFASVIFMTPILFFRSGKP